MKNKKFDKIMKSKLQGLESAPPKGTFAAIQNRMKAPVVEEKAVAFVWPPVLKYGLAASLAFFFGLATMNWFNNNDSAETLVATNENVNTQEEITSIENEIEENKLTVDLATVQENKVSIATPAVAVVSANEKLENESLATNVNNQKVVVTPSNKPYSNTATSKSLDIFSEEQGKIVINVEGVYAAKQLEKQENIQVYALYSFENELEEEKIELAKIEEDPTITRFQNDNKKMGYTGFWFGPTLSGNHQTLSGKNLFGLGLGADFGYDIKPNFGIQSGFHYKSMVKEVLGFNDIGNPMQDIMDLSHFSIPFALKWKKSYFAKNVQRPVSFNAYLGGDYARLTKLKKNQLGVHLGLEYDIFMKPEMMFTVGVKTGVYSILDYSPEQVYLQGSYRKFNYAMSLYASLRFISPKRR